MAQRYLNTFQDTSAYNEFAQTSEFVTPNISYCIEENKVIYNRFEKYKYVDLGLPSGTLWAECNVGADSSTDKGLYFAWGDIAGRPASQIDIDNDFGWHDYKFANTSDDDLNDNNSFTKYKPSDNKTVLDLDDDAAYVNWGPKWHIPAINQWQELLDETYTDITYDASTDSALITSKINGNTLIFPFFSLYDSESAVYSSNALSCNLETYEICDNNVAKECYSIRLYKVHDTTIRIGYFENDNIYRCTPFFIRPVKVNPGETNIVPTFIECVVIK